MEKLHAVVRIEKKTGKPAIFYREHGRLTVYTREEQHSEARASYYRNNTRPSASIVERESCADLVRMYAQLCRIYGGEELHIHARLRNNT